MERRGLTELECSIESVWPEFLAAFTALEPELMKCSAVVELPRRLVRLAEWVNAQLAVQPTQRFCTLLHGDYKAANLFLDEDAGIVDIGFVQLDSRTKWKEK